MFFRTVFSKCLETRFGNNWSRILPKSAGGPECTVLCSDVIVLGYLCQDLMWVHISVYIYALTRMYSNIELGRVTNYCYKITSQHTLIILVTTNSVRNSASRRWIHVTTECAIYLKTLKHYVPRSAWVLQVESSDLRAKIHNVIFLSPNAFYMYSLCHPLGSICCIYLAKRKYYEELF